MTAQDTAPWDGLTEDVAPGLAGRALNILLIIVEHSAGIVLAADVAVVFTSVIFRYVLHTPLDWAEDVASTLMVTLVFLGAATLVGRSQHVGVDFFTQFFPAGVRAILRQLSCLVTLAVAVGIFIPTIDLVLDTAGETTPTGLPIGVVYDPVIFGGLIMVAFAIANALACSWRVFLVTFVGCAVLVGALAGLGIALPDHSAAPIWLLLAGFVATLFIGVPIAFALAFAAMLYFLAEPTLPMLIYSQQLISGANHFVLLAIPFFVLAGLTMEANGMSTRLVELLLRMVGRTKGGLNLIIVIATAFFSGVSGSKLADIAAVGGVVMPAIRRTGQDPNEAAGLLACSAVMAETIPPCVNLIIFGFVANVSIGGLFVAGLLPAAVLALGLGSVAVASGRRADPTLAFPIRRPLPRLIGGALIALVMVLMIGKGVTSGVATSTEVSAFAVVYAFVVGGLTFRELTWRSVARLFVRAASMTGGILFIVAAASSLSYALTIEQIPGQLSAALTDFGTAYGATAFVFISAALMLVFGMVLEGAPALILFGPLLTPIASQLGVNPLQFGTIMVIAMGLGLFSPPIGVGLFATCAITGTRMQDVALPMMKYLAVLALGLIALILVPAFALWLPSRLGLM